MVCVIIKLLVLSFCFSLSFSDCEVLAEFATECSNAAKVMGWSDDILVNPSGWCCENVSGITCNNSQVTEISLIGTEIEGYIPSSFSRLLYLKHFASTQNDLWEIEDLPKNLTYLSIVYAFNLNNSFLDVIINLPHLTFLQIYDAPCESTLSFVSNLTNLRTLSVSWSDIEGSLEPVQTLTNLEALYLDYNLLEGRLDYLSGLKGLTLLHMPGNAFNQTLDAMRPLTKLESLWLHDSDIKGNLNPLEKLVMLQDLQLATNQLTGTLSAVTNMTQLTSLSAFSNTIRGDLSFLKKLTMLNYLELTGNALTGGISVLSDMEDLDFINLSQNNLNGTIDALQNLTELVVVSLNDNHFSGHIEALTKCTSIAHLSLDRNHFHGSVSLLGRMPNLTQVSLSGNGFTNGLQALSGLQEIGYLNLASNEFSEGLEGVSSHQLSILDITDNKFNGHFPVIQRLLNNTRPLALFITDNVWACPYPVFPPNVTVERDNCVQEANLIVYVSVAAGCMTLIFAVYFCYCKKRAMMQTSSRRTLTVTLWLLRMLPRPLILLTDIMFFRAIIMDHYQYVPVCGLLNSPEVFSLVVPYWPYDPLPTTNSFTEYIQRLKRLLTPTSLFVKESIKVFSQFCNDFDGCGYVASQEACQVAPSSSVDVYFVLLIAFIALRACKEIARLMLIFYAVKRQKLPSLTFQFVSISICSPVLLCLMRSFVDDVLLPPTSAREWQVILLTEVVLHSIPQLALGFYYYFAVVQTGLDWTVIVSVGITITSAGFRIVQSCAALREAEKKPDPIFKAYDGRFGSVNAEAAKEPFHRSFSRRSPAPIV